MYVGMEKSKKVKIALAEISINIIIHEIALSDNPPLSSFDDIPNARSRGMAIVKKLPMVITHFSSSNLQIS